MFLGSDVYSYGMVHVFSLLYAGWRSIRTETNSDADKCLVFSQWDDMLDIVEMAFKENDVR